MSRYIWVKGKRYYYYETYRDWNAAMKIAKYYRKKNGSRYFVLKVESGLMYPKIVYKLFLDKIVRLGFL